MNKKKKDTSGHSSEADFVKVDLHIHTPASSCYKGSKDDDEYLRILERAQKKDIKILAITDHNSIRGYRRIVEIKNQLVEEKTSLSTIKDSEGTQSKLKDINKKLSVFEGLLVLPGIEFEVNNGIHLLIVFDEKTQIDQIEKFLLEGGYDENTFGREKTTRLSNWSIFDFYDRSKKYDCIVIDAHTDSDKGIWNTIGSGQTRAACFRDSQLCAIGFKNEKQKESIIQLLSSSLDYKRSSPIAFVRFSDAHIYTEVGSLITWVKVGKNDFSSLKSAFANPKELITTEKPNLEKILNNLIKENISFGIEDLSDQNLEQFKKLVCALNNSQEGYLLLGVTKEMNKVGLPFSESKEGMKAFSNTIKQVFNSLSSIEGLLFSASHINAYPLQNNKIILSLRVPRVSQLVTIKSDGRVFTIEGRGIKVLSGPEVQNIIEERTARTIETGVGKRISEIEKNYLLIKNYFASLPIIRKFENKSIPMPIRPNVAHNIGLSRKEIVILKKTNEDNPNGKSKGNVFYFAEEIPPRLPYAYLRYSVPLFSIRSLDNKTENKETVYLVPGGGVFYSKRSYPYYCDIKSSILKIHKSDNPLYSMKFITAYLKSSFLLWYLLNKYNDSDLWSPNIYKNIRIPKLRQDTAEDVKRIKEIEYNVDEILNLERKYFLACQRANDSKLIEITTNHNANVDSFAYAIDHIVFQIIQLSEEEIRTIESHLRLNDLYLPKKTKDVKN
jgi:hypothetical protein